MCFSEGLYTEIDGVYFDKTDRSSLSIDKDNLEQNNRHPLFFFSFEFDLEDN